MLQINLLSMTLDCGNGDFPLVNNNNTNDLCHKFPQLITIVK